MRRRLRFLVIALAALGPPASALDGRRLWHYGYSQWQDRDGLPQNTVQAIAQTPEGYLWLGTEAGLVRFNGSDFRTFDTSNTPALRSNSVTALTVGPDGTLWVGTRAGLLRLRGEESSRVEGIPNSSVRALAFDRQGALWIGTNAGLARWHNGQITRAWQRKDGLGSNAIRALSAAPEGVWVGSSVGLNWASHRQTKPSPVALPVDTVRAICQDRQGIIWIGTERSGLFDSRGRHYTTRQGLTSDSIRALLEDRDGNLWIGTVGGGLNRLRDGRIDTMTQARGLASDHVRALFEDREGSLWVGTEAGGLAQLRNGPAITYTPVDGLRSAFIRGVNSDAAGNLWVGTEGAGLHRRQDDRFWSDTALPVANAFVTALHFDRHGNRWVGTEGAGAFRSMASGYRPIDASGGRPENSVWAIAETPDGAVWLGSSSGLLRHEAGQSKSFTTADGLRGNSIRALHGGEDGRLWIALRSAGLQWLRDGRFENVVLPAPFHQAAITSFLAAPGGRLWITTSAGLLHWDGQRMHPFTRREGLHAENLFQALEGRDGQLWLSSSRGIFSISGPALLQAGRARSMVLTTSDGLRTNECSGDAHPAGARTPDGSLWFATIRGLVRILPQGPIPQPVPTVVLEGVSIDGQPSTHHVAPPGNRLFTARFAALTFLAPDRVRYRYRLDGLDSDWIESAGQNEATYHGLPPGEYVFRAQASADGQSWTPAEARWPLRVEPRFYQTGWFYGTAAAALAALAYAAHRLRALAMQRRFDAVLGERIRIAREMHDTLLQGFAGAALQLNAVAKRWTQDPAAARRQLDGVLTQIDDCLADARVEIGELRDGANVAESFQDRLFSAARGATDITVAGPLRPLRPDVEKNLLRIAREAVTNALRHAHARTIRVRVDFEPGHVRLTARDDGRGLPAAIAEGHFGIVGMRERAQALGGEFALRSREDEGTEIDVRLPA